MTKALLKKQFTEMFSKFVADRKTGKRLSGKALIGIIAVYVCIFVMVLPAFFAVAYSLGKGLFLFGFTWLYFALLGMVSVTLGVFGSVFNTYASLYLAKDNELLLSMPIPPSKILFGKMLSTYTLGTIFEALVYVPTLVVFFMFGNPTVLSGINAVLMFPLLSIIILVLTCFLGWLIALISTRLKNKSYLTVTFALIFLAGYYYICMKFNDGVTMIINEKERFGSAIKSYAYPLYLGGRASAGDWLSMLIFAAAVILLFALTYYVLSKTFYRITTLKKSGSKPKYTSAKIKTASLEKTLLKKEFKRFTASPTYMLNCGLGVIFMLAVAVVLLFSSDKINFVLSQIKNVNRFIPILVTAAASMLASMNDMTAPSVSLEGKNLWILKTLPFDISKILDSKQSMQIILTLPPAMILSVAACIVTKLGTVESILCCINVAVFVFMMSGIGLMANLKHPNLSWTNEIVPIKQDISVFIGLFGGWAFTVVTGFAGYFISKFISAKIILVFTFIITSVITVLINKWLKTRGTEILRNI